MALESADVVILSNRLESILETREISARSHRKTRHNAVLAFLFNGIGIPVAATNSACPVRAMVAMALSVTTIFLNSLWGRPSLFFNAIWPSTNVDSTLALLRRAAWFATRRAPHRAAIFANAGVCRPGGQFGGAPVGGLRYRRFRPRYPTYSAA